MSRSGYSTDCENIGLWRGAVTSAIKGKRGQGFLRELAAAMDAMPEKRLIKNELVSTNGECCTIGVVCKARNLDVSKIDSEDPDQVSGLVGISHALTAEIEYLNDELGDEYCPDETGTYHLRKETPEERWVRIRKWVGEQLLESNS